MIKPRPIENYTIEELLKHDDRYISRFAEEIAPAMRRKTLGSLAKSCHKIASIPAKNLIDALDNERQGKGRRMGKWVATG